MVADASDGKATAQGSRRPNPGVESNEQILSCRVPGFGYEALWSGAARGLPGVAVRASPPGASLATNAREVVIAALTAVAAAGCLWSRTLRIAAPRTAPVGVASLFAFAIWSGITVLWSVAPDQTWIELNRALSYAIVLCLAIANRCLRASGDRADRDGIPAIAVAVTGYALGQKLLPGLHVAGLYNLNQAQGGRSRMKHRSLPHRL